jgi:hypothetical protein
MAVPDDERFNVEVLLPGETVFRYAWLNRAGQVSLSEPSGDAFRIALVWSTDGTLMRRLVLPCF